MAPTPIENWDDDGDFQGDFFTHSVASSAAHTAFSLSSRAPSLRSESVNDEDDWQQVLIKPNDDASTRNAISQAKQAGIPLPSSTPSSALLGGTIKRLGKTPSRQKITDEDWGDDIELPGPSSDGLKLKTPQPPPLTPAHDDDDFDEWAEGSLGIRFAGTRRDQRTRGSSVSAAMSPSLGSCMTLESEDDDLGGLLLPTNPIDFNAILLKRHQEELDHDQTPQPDPHPPQHLPTDVGHLQSETSASPVLTPSEQSEAQPASDAAGLSLKPQLDLQPTFHPDPPVEPQKQAPIASGDAEDDDFFADVDLDTLDANRHTVNRHVRVKSKKPQSSSNRNSGTTITFTDKNAPSSRIPRPLPAMSSRSRLDPVYESGAPQAHRNGRAGPPSASNHLLRSKRSAPVLRSEYRSSRSSAPFLTAGTSSKHSQPTTKPTPSHLRRESDPRSHSPTPRVHSRLSRGPDTPRRGGNRKDIAPASLVQEATTKRKCTKPHRKRNFGDGTELDLFDDLPTSLQKESGFLKEPSQRPPNKLLRQVSQSKLPQPPERMLTPQPPPTPSRTLKRESLPSFARDTAASRIAREQRLGGPRSRHDGPLAPVSSNWKTQVAAARTPQTSPQANRKRGTGQKPNLIKHTNESVSRTEKGMTYNPALQRWEGNDSALALFSTTMETSKRHVSNHAHSVPQPQIALHKHNSSIPSLPTPTSLAAKTGSPPRPALIAPVGGPRGVQVERGMVFDPRRMCWLKLDSRASGPFSPTPSIGDDEDPFADIDDLKDDEDKVEIGSGGLVPGAGGPGSASTTMDNLVSEEFDLGPAFIRLQHDEEGNWRRRVEKWVGGERDLQNDDWRWEIRSMSASASASSFAETVGPR
ncbi:hypothetical protein BKA81DRAFT_405555 [Phyllosticta paracitricarpa]|uniref:Cytokinesis regulator n=1 Tax=Phyllosticta paracitricarpa TaxID=2016321 RepID=A0ABR1N0C5_9PEZI